MPLVGLPLVAMACGGEHATTPETTQKSEARHAPVAITDPIIGVTTASSVDGDVSSTFVPATPQIAAVVQVGTLPGAAPLTITWYRGEEKLFDQTLQVKSWD